MAGAGVSRPPRVVHSNDVEPSPGPYAYDLIVVGGGSGGISCAKEAASHGARVALLDYVKPSWAGTKWGLGGTVSGAAPAPPPAARARARAHARRPRAQCVNVGCIPKKLMHTAALLGESLTDAANYGWAFEGRAHSWEKLVDTVQDYVHKLNFAYRTELVRARKFRRRSCLHSAAVRIACVFAPFAGLAWRVRVFMFLPCTRFWRVSVRIGADHNES